MKIAVDANVLIDLFEKREPHFLPSATVLSSVSEGILDAIVPGHIHPSVYYVVRKLSGKAAAELAVDWILRNFPAVPPTNEIMQRARELPMDDFEDAIVAVSALAAHCDYVVTRDRTGFSNSPVPSLSPLNLLELLGHRKE